MINQYSINNDSGLTMSDHKPKPEETPAKAEQSPPMKPVPERETGGQPGPEPTRYGDWEKGGIISDF